MTNTVSSRIVTFLGNLHGFDHLDPIEDAIIDLHSGAIVRSDPDDPAGDALILERAPGVSVRVSTYKLVQTFLVRHAETEAVIDGGSVRNCFQDIKEHFLIKTGYGQQEG